MPAPTKYGALEGLPSDIRYLKEVAWQGWEATQLDEKALHDGCDPAYFEEVMSAMSQQFCGLTPRQQVQEALRHRELIRQFIGQYPSDKYPETAALYFIYGALEYADGLFDEESA